MELNKVVAIVTGGAVGFGRAFAERILHGGGKVIITDMNVHQLQVTGKALQQQFGAKNIGWLRQDVTDPSDTFPRVFEYASKYFGRPVNVLINNAGVAENGSFYNEDYPRNWEKVINIDLTALIRGTQVALAIMTKTLNGQEGVIVNLASLAGLNPVPFTPVYAAAKAGVVGFTRSMYSVKKSHNVRCFALCPGFADTDMGRAATTAIPELTEELGGLIDVDTVIDAFVSGLREPDNAGRVMRVLKTKTSYYRFPGDKLLFPNSKL